jgi:hypothetical protein
MTVAMISARKGNRNPAPERAFVRGRPGFRRGLRDSRGRDPDETGKSAKFFLAFARMIVFRATNEKNRGAAGEREKIDAAGIAKRIPIRI